MAEFSETLMDHFQSPRHVGRMDSPDRVGTAGVVGQGRFVEVFLRIDGDRVERMQFAASGCGVTIAVCSVLTELTEGRTTQECKAIRQYDIVAALEGVPVHKQDCVPFVLSALQDALAGC